MTDDEKYKLPFVLATTLAATIQGRPGEIQDPSCLLTIALRFPQGLTVSACMISDERAGENGVILRADQANRPETARLTLDLIASACPPRMLMDVVLNRLRTAGEDDEASRLAVFLDGRTESGADE